MEGLLSSGSRAMNSFFFFLALAVFPCILVAMATESFKHWARKTVARLAEVIDVPLEDSRYFETVEIPEGLAVYQSLDGRDPSRLDIARWKRHSAAMDLAFNAPRHHGGGRVWIDPMGRRVVVTKRFWAEFSARGAAVGKR